LALTQSKFPHGVIFVLVSAIKTMVDFINRLRS